MTGDPDNLRRLNEHPLRWSDHFDSYLIGALAAQVDADRWDRAIETAASCVEAANERRAAREAS